MRLASNLLSLAVIVCLAQVAAAQGPVRRAVRGAAEAAGDVARGAAAVTGDAARATAQGVRAVTPGVPVEARNGGPVDRNASWRTQRYNGDYWYYTPENSWMVYRNNTWTPYSEDTFVPNEQYVSNSQSANSQQTVFIDSGGRAVMCQSGKIVFVDGTALQSVPRSQINAQGYLIQQGSVQGQAAVGQQSVVAGYAPQATTQQSTASQVNAQAPSATAQSPSASVQTQAQTPGQASAQVGASASGTSATPSASAGASVQDDASGASVQGDAGTSSAASSNSSPSSESSSTTSGESNR